MTRDPEEHRPADLRAEATRLRGQAAAARTWWTRAGLEMASEARRMTPEDRIAISGYLADALDRAAAACEKLAELHELLVLEPRRRRALRRRVIFARARRPRPEPDVDDVLERYRRQSEALAAMGTAAADAIITGRV